MSINYPVRRMFRFAEGAGISSDGGLVIVRGA